MSRPDRKPYYLIYMCEHGIFCEEYVGDLELPLGQWDGETHPPEVEEAIFYMEARRGDDGYGFWNIIGDLETMLVSRNPLQKESGDGMGMNEVRCTYLGFGEPECSSPAAGQAQVWKPSGKRSFCAEHMATINKVGLTEQSQEAILGHLQERVERVKEGWPHYNEALYSFWAGYEQAIRDLKEFIRC